MAITETGQLRAVPMQHAAVAVISACLVFALPPTWTDELHGQIDAIRAGYDNECGWVWVARRYAERLSHCVSSESRSTSDQRCIEQQHPRTRTRCGTLSVGRLLLYSVNWPQSVSYREWSEVERRSLCLTFAEAAT